MTDRQTDRQTNRQTDTLSQRKVSLSIIKLNIIFVQLVEYLEGSKQHFLETNFQGKQIQPDKIRNFQGKQIQPVKIRNFQC